jgi:carbonic anhydrase/acetyltransferase-like protein (isoleucine patch superfamily)
MRQRSVITLGHRVPHVSVGAWVAPNAVVIGDVDLLDRVRDLAAAGLQQPQPRQASAADGGAFAGMQVSIWNNVVLRGDLNNITVGSVSNIQARSVVHAAR